MRRVLPVLIVCALTPLAAGCGAEDSVKNAVDPVAQAATNTANAGSVEVAMSGKFSAAGQDVPLAGEGTFDLKAATSRSRRASRARATCRSRRSWTTW